MEGAFEAAVRTILFDCVGITDSEELLIVTDDKKLELSRAVAGISRGCGISTVIVEGAAQSGGEPPRTVANAMLASDAALLITSGSFSNTGARARANENGTRIASMPTITREIIESAMSGDLDALRRRTLQLAKLLNGADTAHITSEAGTDLTVSLSGRAAMADTGDLGGKGAFGNLPCGEACISPVEGTGEGTLVIDGVIFGVGMMKDSPLTLKINGGRITDVLGVYREAFRSFVSRYDSNAASVAEFGIGTNETCHIQNNVLVDEKVFGTVHIACGNNKFIGGTQMSNIHYDMIIERPTVYLDEKCIIRDGEHIY